MVVGVREGEDQKKGSWIIGTANVWGNQEMQGRGKEEGVEYSDNGERM